MAISLFVQCRFSTTLRYSVILLAFLDFRHFPIFHHFLILSDISDIIGYFPNTPHWHYAKVDIIRYFPTFSYIHSDISSDNFTPLDAVCIFSKSDISWLFRIDARIVRPITSRMGQLFKHAIPESVPPPTSANSLFEKRDLDSLNNYRSNRPYALLSPFPKPSSQT